MSKSNKYGYSGVDIPTQAFQANVGKFDPSEINELVANDQWTQYGQLELIESKSASSVSSVIFDNLKEDVYQTHFLTIEKFIPTTDHTDLLIRFYESGVEESGNNYDFAYEYGHASGGFGESRDTTASRLRASFNTGTNSYERSHAYMYFYNLGDSTNYSYHSIHGHVLNQDTTFLHFFGGGALQQASYVDNIKFFIEEASTFELDATLYGIKEYK
tara:strand:- start:482 stop:1129 length:648 start_codon:yes stop_codon:yes gene_type:complete